MQVHRPEFQEYEGLSILSHPNLAEEDRTLRGQFDGGGRKQKHWSRQRQTRHAAANIHRSLNRAEILARIFSLRNVRIQSGVARSLISLFLPVIRKHVK